MTRDSSYSVRQVLLTKRYTRTSCSMNFGDLKMVKVRRGRRGHHKSRSLIFRISRTVPKSSSDDLEVPGSTSELVSSAKPFPENNAETLKITISNPKVFLQNENKRESVPTTVSETFTKQRHDETSVITDPSLELLGTKEPKCQEIRRSSRRIFMKLQKDNESNSCTNQSVSTVEELPSVSSSCNKMAGERKKRGKRPRTRVTGLDPEPKKRKYTRRGRPPSKLTMSRDFRTLMPASSGQSQSEIDKQLSEDPKNSVWTLVPRELFKSNFFKSHVMKVRFTSPAEKNKFCLTPCVPNTCLPSFPNTNNDKIRLKFQKRRQEYLYTEQKQEAVKEYKRPTVIYFRNEQKSFDHVKDHHINCINSQVQYEKQYYKARNFQNYIFNAYHMLNSLPVTNYHGAAGGNLSELVNATTNSLPNYHHIVPSENVFSNCGTKRNFSGYEVYNLNTSAPTATGSRDFDHYDTSSPENAIDILTRNVLVESLRVLFDEEAVL